MPTMCIEYQLMEWSTMQIVNAIKLLEENEID